MSARVTVTTEVVASPPPGTSSPSGQAFIIGATQKGPLTPVQITGLAQYQSIFGDRSGGTDAYDVVESAFKEGLASAWFVRLAGPAAAVATKTLDSKLVVNATSPGAWGNSITVQWVNSTSTLIVEGTSYAAASVAELEAVLRLNDEPVTVSGTLPATNVSSGDLTGGTDDASNAVLADLLELFTADLGDGAVVIAGKSVSDQKTALGDHCEATNRIGLLASTSGNTLAQALTQLATLDSHALVLLWPEVKAGSKTYLPTGFALGARARAHASGNAVQSPISPDYGTARFMDTVVTNVADDDWKTANAAGLSIIRSVAGTPRIYGWKTVSAPEGVLTLQGANYRDLIDFVAVGCQRIADAFVGRIVDGKGAALAEFAGQLTAFLDVNKGSFAAGANDPGYLVDAGAGVNTPADIANGQIAANVSIRCAGTAEFVTIAVVAVDAAGAL